MQFPLKAPQLRERRLVLRSSRQSSRGRGLSCRSSATSLCTSRPRASCAQTQCHLPSVRSPPRSAGGTGPQRGTFGEKTSKDLVNLDGSIWAPVQGSWGEKKKAFGNISRLHFHTLVVCNAATFFTKTEEDGHFWPAWLDN